MYKRLTIILFYVAGFVLVLHNITPHVHTDDPNEGSMPQSLLDWLGFAFQIDPGAGHLEWFSQDKQLDDKTDLKTQVSLAHVFRVPVITERVFDPEAPVLCISTHYVNFSGAPPALRGPPSC